jgi:hypothetical protein
VFASKPDRDDSKLAARRGRSPFSRRLDGAPCDQHLSARVAVIEFVVAQSSVAAYA